MKVRNHLANIMTQISSLPVVPAQPDSPSYGLGSLSLFKSFTRETYFATFGVQAPAFNPSLRPKSWFDTSFDVSLSDGVTIYIHSLGQEPTTAQPLGLKKFAITIQEAMHLNLPGLQFFTPYLVAPTGATVVDLNGGSNRVNANTLSLPSEADAIAADIGAASGTTFKKQEGALGGPFTYTYPLTEARRNFNIVSSDGLKNFNVGSLLILQNANGVGKPGKWVFTSAGEPTWVVDAVSASSNTLPSWDMPLRPLLANEKLSASIFAQVIVLRTDKTQPGVPSATSGSGLTDADRAMLADIQKKVAQLLKLATA